MQVERVCFLEQTNVRPLIDLRFPLSDLAVVFRYQLSGKHFGKIVIDVAA